MPVGSSLTDTIGMKTETVWGTYVVPDHFMMPSEKPDFEPNVEFIEDLPYGQVYMPSDAVRSNEFGGAGTITEIARTKGLGLRLHHLLGAVATSGAGPYTHIFTPAANPGLSATIQQVRTEVDAVLDPFNFLGCVCVGGEFSVTTDAMPSLSTVWDTGTHEVTSAAAAASYPTGAEAYSWLDGVVLVDAAGACIRSITITIEKATATDRRCIGTGKKQQMLNGEFMVTGSMELEFDSMVAYNKFRAGTVAALSVTLARGPLSLKWDIPVLQYRSNAFGGDIGDVNVESFDFKALKGAAALVTATYITSDSLP